MKNLFFSTYIVAFLAFGCQSQNHQIDNYISKFGDTLHVKIPYKILKDIDYNEQTRPFEVCLRDEYSFVFGDLNMHLEHSDYVTLYNKVLKIPRDTLLKFDRNSFKVELEKLFFDSAEVNDTSKKEKLIFNAQLVQEIDENGTYCVVKSKQKGFRYELNNSQGKWYITNKTGYY